MSVISSPKDLATHLGIDKANQGALSRAVYKETGCGAWLALVFDKEVKKIIGVMLGTIVEGYDAEFNADPLYFPFGSEMFDATLNWLDNEVNAFLADGQVGDGDFGEEE